MTEQIKRIAIVTGANVGLGFETTKGLAAQGIHVVMACRNIQKAEAAKKQIESTISYADLSIIQIDTSKLDSVRDFAEVFLSKYERLDILINNAGVMMPPYSLTIDGFETQFATNYLGHFLLTGLLLPVLERTPDSRIISLSSNAHKSGTINFDDLHFLKTRYSSWKAYAQSKLACLIFAYELDRRLKNKLSTTISVAAHPGASNTNLGQHVPKVLTGAASLVGAVIGHKPEIAARSTLIAALDTNVFGGEYYGPSGFGEWKGNPIEVYGSENSRDKVIAKKLWTISEQMTDFSFNVKARIDNQITVV